jgi:hypothetical protein
MENDKTKKPVKKTPPKKKVIDMTSDERHLLSPQDRQALIPPVDVYFNTIITSAHAQRTAGPIIMSAKEIGYEQVVVAVGPNASVKVGDWVHINVDMFPKEQKPGSHDTGVKIIVHPPIVKIGHTEYLYLNDRHVKWKLQSKTIQKIIL